MEHGAGEDEAPRKLVLSSVDAMLAEILSGSAALHELIGPAENLAEALSKLVDPVPGQAATKNGSAGPGGADPAFRRRRLCPKRAPPSPTASSPNSRATSGFAPIRMVDELKTLRIIANRSCWGWANISATKI